MRRISVLSVMLAVLATLLPQGTALAGPAAYAGASQVAFASDTVRIGHRLYMYVAGGYRTLDMEGDMQARGFATRGRCFVFKRAHFKVTMCSASWRPRKVSDKAFTFEPTMESAHLSLKDPKGATKLNWTGRNAPSPDVYPAADPSFGAFAFAHVYRDARAKGTILGRKLELKGFDAWSFLDQGADAFVFTSRSNKLWQGPGGRFHLRTVRRVRI